MSLQDHILLLDAVVKLANKNSSRTTVKKRTQNQPDDGCSMSTWCFSEGVEHQKEIILNISFIFLYFSLSPPFFVRGTQKCGNIPRYQDINTKKNHHCAWMHLKLQ